MTQFRKPGDVQHTMAVLRGELAANFAWLFGLGYAPPVFEAGSDGIGTWITASFIASTRELRFYLVASPKPLPDAPDRHVLLVNLYPEQAARGNQESIDLAWYAVLHRRDLADAIDALEDRPSTIDEFVRDVVPLYRRLMEEHLLPFLSGREWMNACGDPATARAFEFLVTDYGFPLPQGSHCGIQVVQTYRRGDVIVSISWEGSLILTISAGHEPMRSVYGFTFEQAVEFLKAHPEVLVGDLRAVDAVIRAQGGTG